MSSLRRTEVDAVVIGAGLIGMFSALYMHECGLRKVVVIDKARIGGIASPRAAGMLRRHYHIPLLVELATLGEEIYASFKERLGSDVGYTKRGYLLVVEEDKQAQIEKNVEMQQQLGVDVEMLSQDQVNANFPEFKNLGAKVVAAYESSCSYADPPAVCRALADVLRERNVTLIEDDEVVHIDIANGSVCGVDTQRTSWQTNRIINCAGAWGRNVGRLAGLQLPVEVKRLLQIIEVHRQEDTSDLHILSHDALDFYARPNSKSSVLIGGRIPFSTPKDASDTSLIGNHDKAGYLREAYQQVSTARLSQITNGWAGIDGDTPDYQPIIGPHEEIQGLFSATGFSGHGFKLAPIIGKLISEYAMQRKLTVPDISILGHQRFKLGNLLPSGYKQMGS